MEVWVERELDGSAFADQRLKARLGTLLGDLGRRIGGTIQAACQDWAATKASYGFFSNPRVNEGAILAGHFAATTAGFAAPPGRSWSCTTRPSSASPATPRRASGSSRSSRGGTSPTPSAGC